MPDDITDVTDESWYIFATVDGLGQYWNRTKRAFQPAQDSYCAYWDPEEAAEALDMLLGTIAVFAEDAVVVNQDGEVYEE